MHVAELFLQDGYVLLSVLFRISVIECERSRDNILRDSRDRNHRSKSTTLNSRSHGLQAGMTGNVVNPAGIPGTDPYACRILVVLPTQRTLQFPDKAPGVSCAGNRLCNSLCV